jgi:hypothetical protein
MPRINLADLAEQSFGTSLEQLDDRRIYKLLAKLVQERSAACPLNNGKKKLYYISAEFLIGKLLINNMIDLGIYDEVKDQLTAAGHDLNKIEEFEVEPSQGTHFFQNVTSPRRSTTWASTCPSSRTRSPIRPWATVAWAVWPHASWIPSPRWA